MITWAFGALRKPLVSDGLFITPLSSMPVRSSGMWVRVAVASPSMPFCFMKLYA